jgi:plastocyanin domain-containing protein
MGNRNKFLTICALVIAILLIGGAVIIKNRSSNEENSEIQISSNVSIENGIQIIDIDVRSGYYAPRLTYANKDLPTKLRMNSVDSYGCERAFRIPSLNISSELPPDGLTEFELGRPTRSILGTCSMGMYTFLIKFI